MLQLSRGKDGVTEIQSRSGGDPIKLQYMYPDPKTDRVCTV